MSENTTETGTNNNQFQGKTIEGYHILKPLGQGKFSTVYKAEVVKDQRIVALKKIKIFDMMDPKQREKCLKEVQLMQPLDHMNIIKYLDSFIYNNELIIVTEWAERGDLKKLIKTALIEETPFDEIKIWDFIQQISSALSHMSDKRIMHRDLKPANIFISANGTLKIGDLGLGRIFSSQTMEAYSKVGTPLYMSPELLRGEGYDMKSDVWSLGCIAYELCQLKSPFREEGEKLSLMELFTKITKGQFKGIDSQKYSDQLSKTINNMIVIDPSYRCDSKLVYEMSVRMIQTLQKQSPKVDCTLIMEDIYEKLQLINYKKYAIQNNKPQLNKLFFSQFQTSDVDYFQLQTLIDIFYWIFNKQKNQKKEIKVNTKNIKRVIEQFISDIKKLGINQKNIDFQQLECGFGETVCFLLNDVVNRELLRLNFKFQEPKLDCNQSITLKVEEQQELNEDDLLIMDYES